MANNLSASGQSMLERYLSDKPFRDAVHADPAHAPGFDQLSGPERAALMQANAAWKKANLSDADRATIAQGMKAGATPYALFW